MAKSKATILRDSLLTSLSDLAADQWPWPDDPGATPAPVVDELEVVPPWPATRDPRHAVGWAGANRDG